MEYALLFYGVSILNNLKDIFGIFEFLFTVAVIILFIARLICWTERCDSWEKDKTDEELAPGFKATHGAIKKSFTAFLTLLIVVFFLDAILPSKKDAMVIVAGIGVVEAIKSETVKSVGSKSVAVVEKWLDEQLAETGKKAVNEASKAAVEAGKEAVKEAVKEVLK